MIFIDGLVSIALLVLVALVPKLKPDSQRAGAYTALGLLVCAYSFLLLLFRLKNGSYPFKLVRNLIYLYIQLAILTRNKRSTALFCPLDFELSLKVTFFPFGALSIKHRWRTLILS
jgi:hypothetical protein